MYIIKRNGKQETLKFAKISSRIKRQTFGLNSEFVDADQVATKVISGLFDGVTTQQIDKLAAETAASFTVEHPDYSYLASRLAITSLYKDTTKRFSDTIEILYKATNEEGEVIGLISEETYNVVQENKDFLDSLIVHDRDSSIDYFGFKTLERAYLMKVDGKVVETPQQLYLRVAVGIWGNNLEKVADTYNYMSEGYFTHATPTLFNSGTSRPQLSSCFLLDMEDSIGGIYKTLSDCAYISKNAGGIGLNVNKIRSKGSLIKGTNGASNGIVPMLRVFNATARYVDQGGGKRKGSISVYLEPWHADILDFLDLKKPSGAMSRRTLDLFPALWVCDLFMQRVKEDGMWSLFSPDVAKELGELYDDGVTNKFTKKYEQLEAEGKFTEQIKAQKIWYKIVESQIETGSPYLLYKDAANKKSNQNNLGIIKSSNLCCEIIEYTDKNEVAVCNLASVALNKFVSKARKNSKPVFDFQKLYEIVEFVTENLDKVIDRSYYPIPEAEYSNKRHRPIGIGVQGLADTFALMEVAFDSEEARDLNRKIFETIYHAAVTTSTSLAEKLGAYETFEGSLASKGILQFDLWDGETELMYDNWDEVKENVQDYWMRNSLLVAPMPTASTAQILGNNECFEPFTSNFYSRSTLSGKFALLNKHMVRDLVALNLWSPELKKKIIKATGSIQGIEEIPQNIRDRYKTVWELSQKAIIDMAADRGRFICQSQSMNLFVKNPTFQKITSMHFYAWSKGLKTGVYYLRTEAKVEALKGLGIDLSDAEQPVQACSLDDPNCEACGA